MALVSCEVIETISGIENKTYADLVPAPYEAMGAHLVSVEVQNSDLVAGAYPLQVSLLAPVSNEAAVTGVVVHPGESQSLHLAGLQRWTSAGTQYVLSLARYTGVGSANPTATLIMTLEV